MITILEVMAALAAEIICTAPAWAKKEAAGSFIAHFYRVVNIPRGNAPPDVKKSHLRLIPHHAVGEYQ